jgi:Spy/CpxP family protein refolding chaperone
MHSQNASERAIQSKKDSLPQDDFAGLTYTEEQKAEIEKIHREVESNMAAVAADEKLNADQKNAMLQGYARIESGRRFQILSPEQQRQVRERVAARRAAEQAANKQPPARK